METLERPTDTEQAAEAGMSRTAFSLRKNGKRGLSSDAESRYQAVTSKYANAEQQHDLEQRETVARSELSEKLLAIVTGTDDG